MAIVTTRIALIACAAAFTVLSPVRADERAPLKIGLILPYKGVWAAPTENIDRGFRVALAEFGNKVAGRAIEVVRADDEMTPNVAVQKFNKLVQLDKVDVMGVIRNWRQVRKPLVAHHDADGFMPAGT